MLYSSTKRGCLSPRASCLEQQLQNFINSSRRPLVVVLGPTASGKTAFSIGLALSVGDAEIVNADSRQLYKYLDIGTAKISPKEMRGIPHHLLDVLDPKEAATAARYKQDAERVIHEIHSRHHVPMMVGGSMLYLSAVIDGLEFPDSSDPWLRKSLAEQYDRDGGASLYKKLLEADPDTALAFSKNNKPYVVRAMEIYEHTGRKPSDARRQSASPYDLFILGIERTREELRRRINERTEELFKKGWAEEVRSLIARGFTERDPAMNSHGYREIMHQWKMENGILKKEVCRMLADRISAKTRQYAKRQLTWWKKDSRIRWLRMNDADCTPRQYEEG